MYQVFGLPLHPLVVHAVVVLVPLSALGLIACVLNRRLRRNYAGLAVLGLCAGTASAYLAALAGHALAEQVGTPAVHQAWAEWLPRATAAAALAAVVWYFLQRGNDAPGALPRVVGIVATVLSAVAAGLTGVVGHTGATAVWGATLARAPAALPASAGPWSSASPSSSGSATSVPASTGARHTMTQVKRHNSATDCWAVIAGEVYDLTAWVSQHPGGSARITGLCGTDATAAFTDQHGDQSRPNSTLTRFHIGTLAG